MVEPLLDFATANLEVLAGATVVLISVLLHFKKTGRLPLGRLPWQGIRMVTMYVTSEYFKRPRPTGVPGIVVEATPESLDTTLRLLHYESGDRYSFEYDGEVLNLRRPDGYFQNGDGELATEVHARGFVTDDDRLLILTHHEASRLEEWGPHINSSILSWQLGREKMKADLDKGGFKYEMIESEDAADINVVS